MNTMNVFSHSELNLILAAETEMLSLFPLKYFVFVNSCWQNNYIEKPSFNEGLHSIQCAKNQSARKFSPLVDSTIYQNMKDT